MVWVNVYFITDSGYTYRLFSLAAVRLPHTNTHTEQSDRDKKMLRREGTQIVPDTRTHILLTTPPFQQTNLMRVLS